MMMEEERLRREKEDLDDRYQKELRDRQRNYEGNILCNFNLYIDL